MSTTLHFTIREQEDWLYPIPNRANILRVSNKLNINLSIVKEYHLLQRDTVQSANSSQSFRRNVLPPPSGLQSKPIKYLE
jgi:hypothetical protein